MRMLQYSKRKHAEHILTCWGTHLRPSLHDPLQPGAALCTVRIRKGPPVAKGLPSPRQTKGLNTFTVADFMNQGGCRSRAPAVEFCPYSQAAQNE